MSATPQLHEIDAGRFVRIASMSAAPVGVLFGLSRHEQNDVVRDSIQVLLHQASSRVPIPFFKRGQYCNVFRFGQHVVFVRERRPLLALCDKPRRRKMSRSSRLRRGARASTMRPSRTLRTAYTSAT